MRKITLTLTLGILIFSSSTFAIDCKNEFNIQNLRVDTDSKYVNNYGLVGNYGEDTPPLGELLSELDETWISEQWNASRSNSITIGVSKLPLGIGVDYAPPSCQNIPLPAEI